MIGCNKCGVEKTPSEFNKSSRNKTGLQSCCRDCQRGYESKRRLRRGQKPRKKTNCIKKFQKEKEFNIDGIIYIKSGDARSLLTCNYALLQQYRESQTIDYLILNDRYIYNKTDVLRTLEKRKV